MKLKEFEVINFFRDFKSVKIKTADKENRKLYAVERGPNDTEILTRLYFLKANEEIKSFFTRDSIKEIISSLKSGEYQIIRVKSFWFFSRYYVFYKNAFPELSDNTEYPKEEYFTIREKRPKGPVTRKEVNG